MESFSRFSRIIFVVLSFTALLLSGCGSENNSTPAAFTADKVSGKTFAFSSSTGSTGTLAFRTDNTWNTTVGTLILSGTWSINESGKLVCVTTTGGNFVLTYTLLSSTSNALTASVVQINPADPANPTNYTSTLTDISILPGDLVGTWSDIKMSKSEANPVLVKINPSPTGKYSTLTLNADGTGSLVQYTETLNVTTGEFEIKSDVIESTTSFKWTLVNNRLQFDVSGTLSSWALTKNADGTITEVGTDGYSYMIQRN